ncbi:putative ABC transporter permease yvrN [Fibrisoma limi BUZ 3]|uniref:Putative ABC transporter permease yvrN n=1 Tax=Fibrisoma limi BUZ 3 TaxID=1185876 RepID=I2GEX6_9BACT|nr:ABC transporter permease [Fibrisoma limi]CCH52451.1 putative ABC transporter permease yvrN [Fibrisoma limi BUZ 3]
MSKAPLCRPPRFAQRLLRWFCAPHRLDELEGDLDELFQDRIKSVGVHRARWRYLRDVLSLMQPQFIKREEKYHPKSTTITMIRNYVKIAFRNLLKNRAYSVINIGGLAIGMAVAMLIGLWVYDELSYNTHFTHYEHIAEVRHYGTVPSTGIIRGSEANPIPLATALKVRYGQNFKHILLGFWDGDYAVSMGEKKLTRRGKFIEGDVIDMLSLRMLKGSQTALNDPHSVILSQSTAKAIFGDEDPIARTLKIDNRMDVTVTGVYEDLPENTSFSHIEFFAPWALWVSSNTWVKNVENSWDNSSFSVLVQLADRTSLETANAALTDFYVKNVPKDMVEDAKKYKMVLYLYPMQQWHLYSEFKDGLPAPGRLTFVWLFGIVGGFVLLLACINFMNLSTARSEKRAKEVGIRKAIGSLRSQLINQFLSESFLVVFLAFIGALLLVSVSLSWFNELADKAIAFPWSNLYFWSISAAFLGLTGLLSGLYPAFYLSSFQPIKVLKGSFRLGNMAALPRKILVVVQFTVSVVLIIGVSMVYKQIIHAQNRPVGYNREGLLSIPTNDPNYKGREETIQRELMRTGMVVRTAFSSSPLTNVWNNMSGFNWKDKDPKTESDFSITHVSHDFGALAGWQFLAGRDFSRSFRSDSSAVILNETAAKYLNLKNRSRSAGAAGLPIGEFITMDDGKRKLQIIGVIRDMVMQSPFEPVKRGMYFLDPTYSDAARLNIRLNPQVSPQQALPQIEAVIKKIVPSALFKFSFVDQDFAAKFAAEQRIGKLALVFTILAILISCLGLFGLASFTAEQRTKEIGVRKVLGATVLNLWGLLSKDFVLLVLIAFLVASPIAWYFLNGWLQQYTYRTQLSWWVFALAGGSALVITLLTVSFQAIKAALVNPVKSLRSE